MDDRKVPDSFDSRQPDLPTLAVDPDPDDVTEDGQGPGKYPAEGTRTHDSAPRAAETSGGGGHEDGGRA